MTSGKRILFGAIIAVGAVLGIGAGIVFGPMAAVLLSAATPLKVTVRDVEGTVRDDRTGLPVEGARVEIGSSLEYGQDPKSSYAEGRTDARGAFRVHMAVGGTTQFDAIKAGYLRVAGCRDPYQPVEILMRAIPPDSGFKVGKWGYVHAEELARAMPIRLELEHGVVAAGDTLEDIRVFALGDSVLRVEASPGRSIQWLAIEPSPTRWSHSPLNACEAPSDGYGPSFQLRADTPRGLCFVRRDHGPHYGGFLFTPAGFFGASVPAGDFKSILNLGGGRGLCTSEMYGWAEF